MRSISPKLRAFKTSKGDGDVGVDDNVVGDDGMALMVMAKARMSLTVMGIPTMARTIFLQRSQKTYNLN